MRDLGSLEQLLHKAHKIWRGAELKWCAREPKVTNHLASFLRDKLRRARLAPVNGECGLLGRLYRDGGGHI